MYTYTLFEPSWNCCKLGIPAPVKLTVVFVDTTSATVSWEQPDGMNQIQLQYQVSYQTPGTDRHITTSTSSLNITLADLRPASEYSVSVCCLLHNRLMSPSVSTTFTTSKAWSYLFFMVKHPWQPLFISSSKMAPFYFRSSSTSWPDHRAVTALLCVPALDQGWRNGDNPTSFPHNLLHPRNTNPGNRDWGLPHKTFWPATWHFVHCQHLNYVEH